MPGFSTRAIRAASRVPMAPQAQVNVPIYQTSTFEVGDADELAELLEFARPGHSYTRYSNPTHAARVKDSGCRKREVPVAVRRRVEGKLPARGCIHRRQGTQL